MRRGEGDGDQRVAAEAGLARRAVESDERVVDPCLIGDVQSGQRRGDLAIDGGDRARDVISAEARAAVAEVQCLARTGRGTGRRNRPGPAPVREHDLRLDGRASARIPDAAADDLGDRRGSQTPTSPAQASRTTASAAGGLSISRRATRRTRSR